MASQSARTSAFLCYRPNGAYIGVKLWLQILRQTQGILLQQALKFQPIAITKILKVGGAAVYLFLENFLQSAYRVCLILFE